MNGERERLAPSAVTTLILLVALMAAAAIVDVLIPVTPRNPGNVVGQGPVAAGTWYCPVTAGGTEAAVLTMAAIGRQPSTVVVTRYRDGQAVDDPPATLAAGDALDVPLPPPQAAMPLAVRWQGGPAVTHWRVDGAGDSAAAPCEPGPSSTWHLTGFDTRIGSKSTVHLFNPYGEDAVARLRFATADGPVDLVIADNQLVKAGTSSQIDLAEFQPEEPDLGVTVEVLTGRLVVQGQIVLAAGRALLRGTPISALEWDFAQARMDGGSSAWLSIHNTSDREAAIEVQVSDPKPDAEVLLSETSVPAGGVIRVDLDGTSARPEFGVAVTSVNEAPVVASAFWSLRTPQGSGLAASLGTPGPGTEWALVGGGTADRTGEVSIYNPGSKDATVTILSPRGRLPQWSGLTVRPNARLAVDLAIAGAGRSEIPVRVVSDRPVVVELRSLSAGGAPRLWASVGVPAIEWTGPPTRPTVRWDSSLETVPLDPRA